MEITNTTNYDTRYLRRLFMACEKYASFWKMCTKDDSKYRTITIMYKKGFGVHGLAWINSHDIIMKLPKNPNNSCQAQSICRVYIHEIEHNSGKQHRQMAKCSKRKIDFWPDEETPRREPKEKPKINIIEKREAKARVSLKIWQTKLKRAKTGVKKYQAKVRYYEKRKAASN